MQMTLRWYGKSNPIPIQHVRQIPCVKGIVSEIEAPVGSIWDEKEVLMLRKTAQDAGLDFSVVESVKVHEAIKLGLREKDQYIENFIANLRMLGRCGIRVVCYDFMPVFDWMRTQTQFLLPDGSNTMAYIQTEMDGLDPLSGDFVLEDWEGSFTREELARLLDMYKRCDEEELWKNLEYFLKAVIPAAQEADVKMGMHPDDPPWSIFGLPRIITNESNIDRMLSIVDSPYNALTLCSGSLGADSKNDVPAMIRKYVQMDRICFGHVRNVKHTAQDGSFEETSHYAASGSLDIVDIMRAYWEAGYKGPIRPDHGRMIFGEKGMAGYGLYDRALGAMYLSGIWDAFENG